MKKKIDHLKWLQDLFLTVSSIGREDMFIRGERVYGIFDTHSRNIFDGFLEDLCEINVLSTDGNSFKKGEGFDEYFLMQKIFRVQDVPQALINYFSLLGKGGEKLSDFVCRMNNGAYLVYVPATKEDKEKTALDLYDGDPAKNASHIILSLIAGDYEIGIMPFSYETHPAIIEEIPQGIDLSGSLPLNHPLYPFIIEVRARARFLSPV